MRAIKFPEVNVNIAEKQDEYETIPANIKQVEGTNMVEVAMCLQLDEEEKKQVAETGCVWLTIMQPAGTGFNPIKTSLLKPNEFFFNTELSKEEQNEWEAMGRKPAE
jgi:hypothetical protein